MRQQLKPCKYCGFKALRQSDEDCPNNPKNRRNTMKLTPIKANMTEVEIGDKTVLFSYKTPVAYHLMGHGYIKTNKKWSTTTTRHINQWLNGNNADEVDQNILDNLIK